MQPKFAHDHPSEFRFLGHFFNHDVYVTSPGYDGICGMGSIIARYGDDPSDYASQSLYTLLHQLTDGGKIGGTDKDGASWAMRFDEWIFSDRSIPSTSAMILALAIAGIDRL